MKKQHITNTPKFGQKLSTGLSKLSTSYPQIFTSYPQVFTSYPQVVAVKRPQHIVDMTI